MLLLYMTERGHHQHIHICILYIYIYSTQKSSFKKIYIYIYIYNIHCDTTSNSEKENIQHINDILYTQGYIHCKNYKLPNSEAACIAVL